MGKLIELRVITGVMMNKLLTICAITLSLSTPALASIYIKIDNNLINQRRIIQLLPTNIENGSPLLVKGTQEIITDLINENNTFQYITTEELKKNLNLGIQMIQTAKVINLERIQLTLGAILMFIICVLRVFWTSLPDNALPWLALALTMTASTIIGTLLGSPGDKIFIDALMISTSAGGLWSLMGKHICRIGR
jgi:hypothetical protein